MGYLTKRVPAIAAKIAIVTGSLLYILSQFVLKPYVVGEENYPHFLHVMAILFLLNVAIMLIIGKLYPRKEDYVQEYTKQVSIEPYKYVKQVGAVICFIVVVIYIYFAR